MMPPVELAFVLLIVRCDAWDGVAFGVAGRRFVAWLGVIVASYFVVFVTPVFWGVSYEAVGFCRRTMRRKSSDYDGAADNKNDDQPLGS
jgi:hypothetical protein